MKTSNKLNPGEVFFATYIALVGVFLIITILLLTLSVEPIKTGQKLNKENNLIFERNQKIINQLNQKQPVDKATELSEPLNQKRINPFE